ncbi:hypothetical protein V8B55DRAFT_1566947 [Mucor lusitanicus]|uniref:Uncharacterized protein n=2 Tax=Mucor circinelloides f. lusitanicus TaxID=29924 RepID=A0A168N5W6_MUCCL|nr:hypothetical protein FB192DRAFT_1344421 [Mucor lusitanicus]OAD05831.1 hypothetical protein MUCCIDRAFT_106390 [Mucor lusitanicus CBS 277.49]
MNANTFYNKYIKVRATSGYTRAGLFCQNNSSRKTGNPFVINSSRPREEFDPSLLEDSDDEVERRQQLQDEDESTDYCTTDDDRQDSPASVSLVGDNGDGNPASTSASTSASIDNAGDISLTRVASSTKRKRMYSNVDEAIREEARQSNREFMAILTAQRQKEVDLSDWCARLDFTYKRNKDICQMHVDAYIKCIEGKEVPDEEQMTFIDKLQTKYLFDYDVESSTTFKT